MTGVRLAQQWWRFEFLNLGKAFQFCSTKMDSPYTKGSLIINSCCQIHNPWRSHLNTTDPACPLPTSSLCRSIAGAHSAPATSSAPATQPWLQSLRFRAEPGQVPKYSCWMQDAGHRMQDVGCFWPAHGSGSTGLLCMPVPSASSVGWGSTAPGKPHKGRSSACRT